MFSQREKLWRKGLTFSVLLLSLKAFGNPTDVSLHQVLGFQETADQLQHFILEFLEPDHDLLTQTETKFPIQQIIPRTHSSYKVVIDWANIPYPNNTKSYYDKEASISHSSNDQLYQKIAEVDWDSKKTGALPGPESSLIKATLERQGELQNYMAQFEKLIINQKQYYHTFLKFSATKPDKSPLQRGIAEIFMDVEKQQIKISSSTIEGPADIAPSQMTQQNLQAIIGHTGYIYLRQEQGVPTKTPQNQEHYCKSPQGTWVSKNSREWDESCLPLFDNSAWHGFSYNSIPASYEPFLKD